MKTTTPIAIGLAGSWPATAAWTNLAAGLLATAGSACVQATSMRSKIALMTICGWLLAGAAPVHGGVFNVRDYGAAGDDQTDNTAAFSKCLNAVIAAGGGQMYLPDGVYRGRITVPPVSKPIPSWITVEIVGESQPPPVFGTVGSFPLHDKGTIVKCLAASGAAVISVSQSPNSLYGGFSAVHLVIRNLNVRTSDNPGIGGIDLRYALQCRIENVFTALLIASLFSAEPLYTGEGKDPSFATLLESGGFNPGERFAAGPVLGSRIDVNNELLEKQIGKTGPIPQDIGIHTQVSGGISRKDFGKWTRWYQEDGSTQVFRLFKDEQNIRGGVGKDASPGRVEAYSKTLVVAPGTWREWEGTYTVIKPLDACIFQLMHEGSLWPFHIELSEKGDISFLRRRPVPGLQKEIVMAENMTGKSLSVKVRANGEDYEVYQKAPLDTGDWKLVTKGSFTKAKDYKIGFRWGMYAGSKKGEAIKNDALLFVTGATVR